MILSLINSCWAPIRAQSVDLCRGIIKELPLHFPLCSLIVLQIRIFAWSIMTRPYSLKEVYETSASLPTFFLLSVQVHILFFSPPARSKYSVKCGLKLNLWPFLIVSQFTYLGIRFLRFFWEFFLSLWLQRKDSVPYHLIHFIFIYDIKNNNCKGIP